MYKHILIPTDGSELSSKAIHHGIALAKAVNAKVTGITVTTPFHELYKNLAISQRELDQAASTSRPRRQSAGGVASKRRLPQPPS